MPTRKAIKKAAKRVAKKSSRKFAKKAAKKLTKKSNKKKPLTASLKEIKNWEEFQSLTKRLLESMGYSVEPSGVGTDDGIDLIASSTISDNIEKHSKKWIVQCKFYKGAVSPSHINDQNLPTLIYSNDATGYLLVVKKTITAKLARLFTRLNKVDEAKLKFKYVVWQESDIIAKVLGKTDIEKQFFPKYYASLNTIK